MTNDYDVVVVGAGGAGFAAGITAHDRGARVLMVEGEPEVGGTTRLSGGVIFAANTSVQKSLGFDDTAEAAFRYYMTLNQWKLDASLIWRYAEESGPALDWLISLGLDIPAVLLGGLGPEAGLYTAGVEEVPRGHHPVGGGAGLINVLEQARRARAIDLALNTRVQRLILEGGRVCGIVADDTEVRCKSVILCTGGFVHNRRLLERYYPEALAAGDHVWLYPGEFRRGDGLIMGQAVGADVVGRNRGLLMVTGRVTTQVTEDQIAPPWLLMVNQNGRRFTREDAPYAVLSGIVQDEGGRVWGLFDDATRLWMDPERVRYMKYNATMIPQEVEKGTILQAETIEALAAVAGVDVTGVTATVERYNSSVAEGRDESYFKPAAHLRAVATPPYYVVELRTAGVAVTGAGLRIDADSRVLTPAGLPIPGLFATGETTVGVYGERYVGGGNSIGQAVIFGRVAGRKTASERESAASNTISG